MVVEFAQMNEKIVTRELDMTRLLVVKFACH
jgi:hypothetical protein